MIPLAEARQERLENARATLAILRARPPGPADVRRILSLETDVAQLGHALGAPAGDTLAALARAATAGSAAALVALRVAYPDWGGEVLVSDAGGAPVTVPVAGTEIALDDWIVAWHAAVVAGDGPATRLLSTAEVIAALTPPADVIPPAWVDHCGLLAAAAVAPHELPKLLAAFADSPEGEPDETLRALRLRPTVKLAEALAAGDGPGLLSILADLAAPFAAWWNERELSHVARAVWPLEATGLVALAVRRGLVAAEAVPPPVPAALLAAPAPAHGTAQVHWRAGAIAAPAEAHWFLDLRAIPREGREHVVVAEGESLIASYRVSAPLVPAGTADFRLVDDAAGVTGWALDAAELLAIAEYFGRSDPRTGEGRERVRQAVEAVDTILSRLPPGADRVPSSTLASERGRRLLAEEPGRLRVPRLLAYRNALAGTIGLPPAEAPGEPSPPPTSPPPTSPPPTSAQPRPAEASAREAALGAAEVIAGAVRPLLEELAGENGAAVAEALVPARQDFAAVFAPDWVDAAAEGYRRAFPATPVVEPPARWDEIEVDVIAAGLLASDNALSRRFPGAMRAIADRLQPHRVWVGWRYRREDGGDRYDGLVHLPDRWLWFPKPWRYFRDV